jgi:hypothetical protein
LLRANEEKISPTPDYSIGTDEKGSYLDDNSNDERYPLSGTAEGLAAAVAAGTTPMGILLDRLQEEPSEVVDCPADVVAAAVAYFRSTAAAE